MSQEIPLALVPNAVGTEVVIFPEVSHPMNGFDQRNVNHEKCESLLEIIGCSNVYKLKSEGSTCACFNIKAANSRYESLVKIYYLQGDTKNNRFAKFMNEVSCLERIEHKNVEKFHSFFKLYYDESNDQCTIDRSATPPRIENHCILGGIVIERLAATLETYCINRRMDSISDESMIMKLFISIGSALVYMHRTLFMFHGDLDKRNIGVTDLLSDSPTIKLMDFGSSGTNEAMHAMAEQYSQEVSFGTIPKSLNIGTYELVTLENNKFLLDSRRFANLVLKYTTIGFKQQTSHANMLTVWNDKSLNEDLKAAIGRMAAEANFQSMTITQVWTKFRFE